MQSTNTNYDPRLESNNDINNFDKKMKYTKLENQIYKSIEINYFHTNSIQINNTKKWIRQFCTKNASLERRGKQNMALNHSERISFKVFKKHTC